MPTYTFDIHLQGEKETVFVNQRQMPTLEPSAMM